MPEPARKTFCAIGAQVVDATPFDSAAPDKRLVTIVGCSDSTQFNSIDARDAAKHILLDLSKRAGVCPWAEVQMDDVGVMADGTPVPPNAQYLRTDDAMQIHTTGPNLTLQPARGGIYLVRSLFENHRARFESPVDPWPLFDARPYQHMSVHYETGARYHGFRATVVATQAPFMRLDVVTGTLIRRLWVNLNDRNECDDPTALDSGDGDPAISLGFTGTGQIFLALELCARLGLRGPKQPPGGGG